MDSILRGYAVNDPTWFYLSTILIVAVFFRFSRLWSVRNIDLLILLGLSPGLLILKEHPDAGYLWLFVASGIVLIRLIADASIHRRPRFEPNLNSPGLAFLCFCVFVFLMTKVATEPPPASAVDSVRGADSLLNLQDDAPTAASGPVRSGPATRLLTAPIVPFSNAVAAGNGLKPTEPQGVELVAARLMAVLSHAAVVLGLFLLAKLHFEDSHLGLAMASLYLLLPCTAFDVGEAVHVLPAALLVWAFVAVNRPIIAGSLLGLACGTIFFPIFLLPLWAAYYGRRRALQCGAALVTVGALLLGSLVLTSADTYSFTQQTIGSIDWGVLKFQGTEAVGFWSQYNPAYRLPVFAAFVVMLVALTIWPFQKSLEHLLAHSCAVIVMIQFWYPQHGGAFILWYLPLLLAVVFRPQLAGRRNRESEAAGSSSQVTAYVRSRPHITGVPSGSHLFR